MYGEVPVEIWKGLPIGSGPVIHINFFTPGSLGRLRARGGYRALTSRQFRGSYAAFRMHVTAVVARRDDTRAIREQSTGVGEARRLLHPTMREQLVHAWCERRPPC